MENSFQNTRRFCHIRNQIVAVIALVLLGYNFNQSISEYIYMLPTGKFAESPDVLVFSNAASLDSFPSSINDSEERNVSVISNASSSDPFPAEFDNSEALNVPVISITPSSAPFPSEFDDSERWCQHLRSTPEPPLVLYNRIAKAGSTTLRKIYKHKPNVRLNSRYWGSISEENIANYKKKFSSIIEESEEGTTTIADGHFMPIFPFPNATFMNMMRLPKSRLVSQFYYVMYDSIAARADNGTNSKYLASVGGSLYLDEKCLTSDKCLNELEGICKTQLSFLCRGGSCGNKTKGSYDIEKILSNDILEVLGFQEVNKLYIMCAYNR